jgi:hypothetical protein
MWKFENENMRKQKSAAVGIEGQTRPMKEEFKLVV